MADDVEKVERQGATAPEKPETPVGAPNTETAKQEFRDGMSKLAARAKEAGVSPIRMMLEAYAEEGRDVVSAVLGALDKSIAKNTKGK